jgi:hypothetical protein
MRFMKFVAVDNEWRRSLRSFVSTSLMLMKMGEFKWKKRKTPSITSLVAIQISFKVGSFLSVKSIERILLSREGREKTLMETDERLRKRKR